MGKIYIGTSGWHYGHWRGPFYPQNMESEDFLTFYAEKFDTVEVNNTFYHLPKREDLKSWTRKVPANFIFSVKASRYITHMKKLKNPNEASSKFLEIVSTFGEKLGPVLFQSPPRWGVNAERLSDFLKVLPKKYRYAFEFRDESWFVDEIRDVLEKNNSAFCIYNLEGKTSPEWLTANFIYIRFHGPGAVYQGSYSRSFLQEWAGKIEKWSRNRDVFIYFNNDAMGYAVENALDLKSMLK